MRGKKRQTETSNGVFEPYACFKPYASKIFFIFQPYGWKIDFENYLGGLLFGKRGGKMKFVRAYLSESTLLSLSLLFSFIVQSVRNFAQMEVRPNGLISGLPFVVLIFILSLYFVLIFLCLLAIICVDWTSVAPSLFVCFISSVYLLFVLSICLSVCLFGCS